MLLLGASLLALSVTPEFAIACPVVMLVGIGNGLVLVYGRVLIQRIVPANLLGRVFGIKDALLSGAFGVAFLTAGALVSLLGTRELLASRARARSPGWALCCALVAGGLLRRTGRLDACGVWVSPGAHKLTPAPPSARHGTTATPAPPAGAPGRLLPRYAVSMRLAGSGGLLASTARTASA